MLTRYGGRPNRLGAYDTSREAYTAWAATVARMGGVVTNAPHYPDNVPAARYPASLVFPNAPATTLGAGFTRMPDDWTTHGDYVYYLAPEAVSGYAATGMLQTGAVPGEWTPPNPQWYDNIMDSLKGVGRDVVVGVGVALAIAYVLRRKR